MSQVNDEKQDGDAVHGREISPKAQIIRRVVLCSLIIALGVAAKFGLGALREPPQAADIPPHRLKVDVQAVYPGEAPVSIFGYGEVRALDSVALTPKVAGEIMEVHPDLEVGKVIPEGELLYRIDQRDYLAAYEQAQAQIERLSIMVSVLRQQYESDRKRLETVRRTREIALEEFNRDTKLYEEQDVGSGSMVNLSEVNYRQAQDVFDQVDQAIELYPMRIREAEAGLRAAKAAAEMAQLSLERTEAYAPFRARVQHKQIEVGQAVAPGVIVLLLANDSVLEISVPIDSRDARRWLPFADKNAADAPNWFQPIEPVTCKITWTEDPDGHEWNGTLHRVERFDPMTRTVTLAIRVTEDTRLAGQDGLPLIEGMFCHVEIPGTSLQDVYSLPRWAVSFDGFTYVADGDRLRRLAVNVVRSVGDEAYVDEGLEPGTLVVTTRLVDPVPGILIDYELPEEADLVSEPTP